jgi:hypothetical protein
MPGNKLKCKECLREEEKVKAEKLLDLMAGGYLKKGQISEFSELISLKV